MIFVDTNVIMYAVGREHPLRAEAREFFTMHVTSGEVLVSSAEVLQELMHAYVPVGRLQTLDAAFVFAHARLQAIWSIEAADVDLARSLADRYSGLGARGLLHLACCRRRNVERIRSFDRGLSAAFG